MKKLPLLQRVDLLIRMFGFKQIPLIYYTGLRVVEIGTNKATVCIPLNRRTKNHLGSMYFGALAIGADVAGGLVAFQYVLETGKNIAVVFKDMQGEFLRRPDGDVHFTCEQVSEIIELLKTCEKTGNRENMSVDVVACVPSISTEPVAKFTLTLSAKAR